MINGTKYHPSLILFDVDGTLVDDTHRYSSLGKARYNAFLHQTSEEAANNWAELSGVNPNDWTIDPSGPISKAPRSDDLAIAGGALYLDGYNWYKARELAEKIYEAADMVQASTFNPQLYKGVKNKLKMLYKSGFTLGIATNGVTHITQNIFEEMGLGSLFTVVIGADLVEKGKPAPDMLLQACKNSGFQLSETIYVGDQPTDIKAANTAGTMVAVAVRNYIAFADENIKSVTDLVIE